MSRSSAFVCLMLTGFVSATTLRGWEDDPMPGKSQEIRVKNCRILLDDQRELASGQAGVISQVHVREGDRVEKGQLLVELDTAIPKASLAVAAKEAENDINVRFARKAAQVAATEYELAIAANREEAQTFSSIEIEKLRLEKERSALQIEVAEHELAVARLRKQEAEAVVDSYQIIAPIDGLITRVYQRAGEAVAPGDPVLEIKQSGTVRIEADLGIEHRADVKPGAGVQIVPSDFRPADDKQEDFPRGKIFFVDVSADLVSKSVRIMAEVDNQQGRLIPGLRTEMIILPPGEKDSKSAASSEDSTTGPPK